MRGGSCASVSRIDQAWVVVSMIVQYGIFVPGAICFFGIIAMAMLNDQLPDATGDRPGNIEVVARSILSLVSFHGFLGERGIIEMVRWHAEGARRLGEKFPDSIFSGVSGLGKTTLARAIALELETELHEIVCTPDTKINDIKMRVKDARAGDIVFLDEAHNLRSHVQDGLLSIIDGRDSIVVDSSNDGDSSHCGGKRQLRCTIILATDQPTKLANALMKRMGVEVQLDPYSVRQLKEIGRHLASNMGLPVSMQAMGILAEHARGVPRALRLHLEGLRRGRVPTSEQVTSDEARRYLQRQGFDRYGLAKRERRYLALLNEESAMSLTALAACLGEEAITVASLTEPWLIRRRLVTIGRKGRTITVLGSNSIDAQAIKGDDHESSGE